MTVVMGGSLEVAVLLLGLVRVGIDSANFSSCLSLFSSLVGDLGVYSLWMPFTFGVFRVAVIGFFSIYGSPVTSVDNFIVVDVKAVVFCGKFVGFPATPLFIVLDKEPEVVCAVKFNRKIHAFVFNEISCVIPNCGPGCLFEVSF